MNCKKYFKVRCKCGHTGSRDTYILIDFPLVAEDAKSAAKEARWLPRCKHHHKDCVRLVEEISYDEFVSLKNKNKEDPYLSCTSSQQQRMFGLDSRFIKEETIINKKIKNKDSKTNKDIYIGKEKIRNPKKFNRLYSY